MWRWILPLLFATACHADNWASTLPTFIEPDSLELFRAVVDPTTGDVVVAGRNVLYRLTPDLEVVEKVVTGPSLDSPDCFLEQPCDNRLKKKTDNDNQVLLMLSNNTKLLICGTLHRGLCQLRNMSSLQDEPQWLGPYNDSLGFSTIAPSPFTKTLADSEPGSPDVVWSALHDDPEMRTPDSPPFLATKVVSEEERKFWSLEEGAIRFEGNSTRYVIEGFLHSDHLYFLIVHTSRDGNATTRLARVSAYDPTLRTYTELTLVCVKTYIEYTIATAAYWDEGKKTLVVALQPERRISTTICGFEMPAVEAAFDGKEKKCLSEEEPIQGMDCRKDVHVKSEHKSELTKIDQPSRVVEPFVSINLIAFLHTSPIVTALTAFSQNGVNVMICGTNVSSILKLNIDRKNVYSVTHLLNATEQHRVTAPLIFDTDKKHIYFVIRDRVVKYPVDSCSSHPSCPRCQVNGKSDPLTCSWCGGTCIPSEDCLNSTMDSHDTCTPVITKVAYTDTSTMPGITLTLNGYGFGPYIDEKHTNVSVFDFPCEVVTWEDNQVVCHFEVIPRGASTAIELRTQINFEDSKVVSFTATSTLNLTDYKVPNLYAIFPSKGPMCGGTHVIIYGENLNVGVRRTINVRGRYCEEQVINANAAWCITSQNASKSLKDAISFHVDNQTFEMNAVVPESFNMTGRYRDFRYLPNPEIQQIYPGITTVSGLMNVSVIGQHLDSVETPEMVVRIALSQTENDLEIKEPCWSPPHSWGRRMTCRTPPLPPRVPRPTRTFPLLTHVTFRMDGDEGARNLHRTREQMSRLMYHPDPEITPFPEMRRVGDNETIIEIEGRYLDIIRNPDNLYVTIDNHEKCKITALRANSLQCELPSYLLRNSSLLGTNFSVEVTVGISEKHLGFLTIVRSEPETSAWKLVVIVMSSCVVIGIIIWFLWKRRKRSKSVVQGRASSPNSLHMNEYIQENNCISSGMVSEDANQSEETEPLISPLIKQETLQILQKEGLIIKTQLLIPGHEIGSGHFGCLYKGLLRSEQDSNRIEVAIKTLILDPRRDAAEQVSDFMKEALLMKNFTHPNVLPLVGVCVDDDSAGMPMIVLPFMEHGDLFKYLRDDSHVIPESLKFQFGIDVANGMEYLAKQQYVHRDLAARNCLLDSNFNTKVSDFGLSRDIFGSDNYRSQNKKNAVPCKWMAPEALEKAVYSEDSDVWSYGVFLWELITLGRTPYSSIVHYRDVLNYVKSGQRLEKPENCPDDLYDLMLECWKEEPSQRPRFQEIKNRMCHLAGETATRSSEYLPMS